MRTYLTIALLIFSFSGIMAQNPAEQKSALLIMDMQYAIMNNLPQDLTKVTEQVSRALTHARKNNMHIIYVKAAFRAGFPEISPVNKFFSENKANYATIVQEEWNIEKSIAPLKNDIIVSKHRISAFQGTDLEMILKANNILHIVLTGVSTSGVVLSTVREAADKDYRITVLSDACADRDEEVHQFLIRKIFPKQAEVITTKEWTQ